MADHFFSVSMSIRVTDGRVRDQLCAAFEGGSNYWYDKLDPHYGEGISRKDCERGGRLFPADIAADDVLDSWPYVVPFIDGCWLTLEEKEEDNPKERRLDRAAIQRGLQIMSEKCPQHFADMMSESGDATTGDVLLQCCVLGDIVYG